MTSQNTILIIDDDDQLRASFIRLLSDENYIVKGAASGEAGLRIVEEASPDLAIIDIRLPGMSGMETFQAIHALEPKLPVIIMTAYGTTATAIEAIKMGAFDYVLKPFEIPEMLTTIQKGLESSRFMRSSVKMDAAPDDVHHDVIVGKSACMQEVYKIIGRVAATDATVLIRGESGTGKELVARALYQHSHRADSPFLAINCVAIPETLLESELFGYEKGAFTGASHRRIGKVEQARGGTIFLDEIGDMPLNLQSKILRLIQEKSIERLGGHDPVATDVRIIAATNRNLEAAIAESQFREDLYYRIKVVTIWLPPLRERMDDIAHLVDHFLLKFSAEEGNENPGISPDAVQCLLAYDWPGNIRELSNIIQKTLIFNRGTPISAEEIRQALHDGGEAVVESCRDFDTVLQQYLQTMLQGPPKAHLFESCTDRFAGLVVREALNITGGNISRAAKILGLSRPTLHSKIEKYGIALETIAKLK
jgi:DNA-binding NtrC family response regulator